MDIVVRQGEKKGIENIKEELAKICKGRDDWRVSVIEGRVQEVGPTKKIIETIMLDELCRNVIRKYPSQRDGDSLTHSVRDILLELAGHWQGFRATGDNDFQKKALGNEIRECYNELKKLTGYDVTENKEMAKKLEELGINEDKVVKEELAGICQKMDDWRLEIIKKYCNYFRESPNGMNDINLGRVQEAGVTLCGIERKGIIDLCAGVDGKYLSQRDEDSLTHSVRDILLELAGHWQSFRETRGEKPELQAVLAEEIRECYNKLKELTGYDVTENKAMYEKLRELKIIENEKSKGNLEHWSSESVKASVTTLPNDQVGKERDCKPPKGIERGD
jgi:uncharacterized protein (UPF0335 family)